MTVGSETVLRGRNVMRGILGGAIGRSVSLVAPFFIMPELLRFLGEARFGIWVTVVSLTSMAAFVDFGIGNGMLTQLAKAYGAKDYPQMRSVITSGYYMLCLIGATLLALLLGIAGLVQGGLLPFPVLSVDEESRRIVLVTLAAFAIGIPVSAINRVMLACQKNILSNGWQIAGSTFAVISCLIAIRAGAEPWAVVAFYAFTPIVLSVIGTATFFARASELVPRRQAFSNEHAKHLLTLGSSFFLLSIITSISLNVDNFIIAGRLGAAAVTEYAVPAKLASLLGLMVTTFFLPLWAANGEALQRRDFAWIRRVSQRMSLIGAAAVGGAGCVLVISGGAIGRYWMGRDFIYITEVMAMLAVLYFLFSIASPFQMLLNSAGIVRVQIFSWGLFLVTSVCAKYLALALVPHVWIVPMLSALAFSVCVLPVALVSAKKVYSNA